MIRIGILTVSDTCSKDSNQDLSGQTLCELIRKDFIPKGVLEIYKIVPDCIKTISDMLMQWSDEYNLDLILTTGGTGFSERDVTPEATKSIIDKEAPAVVHAMTSGSLLITPMAMLSRSVCGIRKKTLIINFPGSRKAASECLNIILPVLPHAVSLLQDQKESIKTVHKDLQTECKLKSHVNVSKVALRDRKSIYPMLDVDKALEIIKNEVKPIGVICLRLQDSLNYVLSEDVYSVEPFPPFRASIKDGYAVRSEDGTAVRRVINVIAAGDEPAHVVKQNECFRINTGAPVPAGADTVIQVEDTNIVEASEDGTEEKLISIHTIPNPGLDIRAIGSDIPQGIKVLSAGTLLKAAELGVLATVGKTTVSVYRKPVIGVMSTGNELQDIGEDLKPGHIRDSNKITLMSLFKQYDYDVVDCGCAKDDPDATLQTLDSALSKCDVLISTGGVSMGDRDLLKQVLEIDLKAKIHFGRVNMKPGKPTTFATCLRNDKKKYIFALPGNPVSSTVTSQLFVLKALRCFSNILSDDKNIKVTCGENLKLDPIRPEYHRSYIQWKNEGAVAYSTGNQISSRLCSMLSAECLLILPAATPSKTFINTGEKVEAIMIKT